MKLVCVDMNLRFKPATHCAFLFTLIIALMNCSKDATGPSSEDYRYPLTTGNTWVYARTITQTYQVSSGQRPPDSSASTITVKSLGQEVLFDTLKTIKLMEKIETDQAVQTHYQFYQNTGTAFSLIASVGAPVALPKKAANIHTNAVEIFAGLICPNFGLLQGATLISADSLTVEKPAKIVLKYPLTPGTEWKYSEKNKPRRINKRVLNETDVRTSAGTFHAVQVRWILDFDGDGEFDDNVEYIDYIANEGLVKRSFLIKDLPIVDDEGTRIGKYDYQDVCLLTSVKMGS